MPQTYRNLPRAERAEVREAVRRLYEAGTTDAHEVSAQLLAVRGVEWKPFPMYAAMRKHGVSLTGAQVREPGRPRRAAETSAAEPEDLVERESYRRELRELRDRQRDDAHTERFHRLLADHLERYRPVAYNPPPGLKPDPADSFWVLHCSDWHVGQRTEAASTGNVFTHDLDIATAQVERMVQVIRALVRDGGREIRNLLLIFNGDIVEGDDMRTSQHRAIEMMGPQQMVSAFGLMRWLTDALHEVVREKITVSVVGGNHDRTTRRAGNAALGEMGYTQTYAWGIGEFLRVFYADDPRVDVLNSSSWYQHLTFGGHRIVHSHGADVKWSTGSYGGVPWYPIARAGNAYADMLDGVDALFLGHGHVHAVLPLGGRSHIFMNGSLPASTEWVQSSFKAVRRPVQQLVQFNKHGAVAAYPLYLDVPGAMADAGEIWLTAPSVG